MYSSSATLLLASSHLVRFPEYQVGRGTWLHHTSINTKYIWIYCFVRQWKRVYRSNMIFSKKKNSSSIMQSWLYHSFAFPKKEVSNAPGIWKKQMPRVGKLTKAFQVSHLGLFWMFSYHCLRLFSVINFYETSSYFFPVVKMRVTSRAPSSTWSKLIHKRISTKKYLWFWFVD